MVITGWCCVTVWSINKTLVMTVIASLVLVFLLFFSHFLSSSLFVSYCSPAPSQPPP
ncbi:hypothetical protein E2C01_051057 [Portunus trituberculatus]|uniref:Uncharacterized protein n=1 Tax=Portunus trituberculatus TaxID=210409 RepID=A0A5B7GKS0_PORTR|nr:hypothetical protein [Portunus trituberculatus]